MKNLIILTLLVVGYNSLYGENSEKGKKVPKVTLRPKCPVCGMYADMDTLWVAEIDLKNGANLFFEGPLHALQFYFNPEKYSKGMVARDDISAFTLRDFATGKKINADSAYFLVDSELKGPMGKDLVPVNAKDSKKLIKKYKGRVMKFSELTKEFIETYSPMKGKEMKGMKMH